MECKGGLPVLPPYAPGCANIRYNIYKYHFPVFVGHVGWDLRDVTGGERGGGLVMGGLLFIFLSTQRHLSPAIII